MRLEWDKIGEHLYETGISNGVLYPWMQAEELLPAGYRKGYAWNGLTGVTESPEGAEPSDQYADNIKYLTLISAENFKGTIEAFTYPEEFAECNGEAAIKTGVYAGQQNRKTFGLCYKTVLGNDTDGNEYGYKLHLVYGCKVSPSEKAYSTINDSPEAMTLSWEFSTTPVDVPGFKPTATLVIDSTKVSKEAMKALEDALYGTDGTDEGAPATDAYLPLPKEVISIIEAAA